MTLHLVGAGGFIGIERKRDSKVIKNREGKGGSGEGDWGETFKRIEFRKGKKLAPKKLSLYGTRLKRNKGGGRSRVQ